MAAFVADLKMLVFLRIIAHEKIEKQINIEIIPLTKKLAFKNKSKILISATKNSTTIITVNISLK
ncbi:hypothetical protein HDEF_0163 [Candidatus Hamiltonella defensa 5AT (Acyrthosiphon pisum)]|uniref:Uncharacterized protein n=1 Tax=Hamiltonella defensa subsp. Acyrthosiphon pisum (strain 5AT) TaxID=572265 RepID=C4K8U8_HAMD5|nr:hypothetical protein HDEF_0163 [Candidatus Hamiltonella defensa 5AT (Acyrthosiphon pisum)]